MINLFLGKCDAQADVIPLVAGRHDCPPSHSYGPFVREYVLIHFCLSGRGVLSDPRGTHPVRSGQMFIIRPGEMTTYTADPIDPWQYVWVGFSGRRAEIFENGDAVRTIPADTARRLTEAVEARETNTDIYTSIVFALIYHLYTKKAPAVRDVTRIGEFVRYHYMENITVSDIARRFALDRTTLFRLFKREHGVSLKRYMTAVRMEHAVSFLKEGHSVAETAFLVGYRDEFHFSAAFRSFCGFPPSALKKAAAEKEE